MARLNKLLTLIKRSAISRSNSDIFHIKQTFIRSWIFSRQAALHCLIKILIYANTSFYQLQIFAVKSWGGQVFGANGSFPKYLIISLRKWNILNLLSAKNPKHGGFRAAPSQLRLYLLNPSHKFGLWTKFVLFHDGILLIIFFLF